MAWDGIRPIELLLGREGLILRRNADLIPLGALRNARNLTLEDSTLRTAGGASKLGTAPAAVTIMAAVDYEVRRQLGWGQLSRTTRQGGYADTRRTG